MNFHYNNSAKSLDEITTYLQSLSSPHTVVVRKPNRTLDQNDYWYWFVDTIAQFTGYTKEQTKMILKKWITELWWLKMYEHIVTPKGIEIDDYVSSSSLKKDEFSLLMKYTMQVCDNMGIEYKYDSVRLAESIFS